MFSWPLFLILVLICIPGLIVAIPSSVKLMQGMMKGQKGRGQKQPSRQAIMVASFFQSLALVAIAAAVGTALAPQAGLSAPFFEALVTAGSSAWSALQPQLLPAVVLGIVGALVFVGAYFLFFRRKLDAPTLTAIEKVRTSLGMSARILYGGIVEEVLIRWGLMTLFVWTGVLLVGEPTDLVMWLAIIVSGILFGLGHTPAILGAGGVKSTMFYAAEISLNLWAGIIFGWLFWQYGLAAAMIAHALFHLVWYPFDRRYVMTKKQR